MIVEIRDEVVTLSGTLATDQWEAIEAALATRLKQYPSGIIINLGGLSQITAEGAKTLREVASYVSRVAPGTRLLFAIDSPNVAKILRGAGGLDASLTVVASVAEARNSLNAAPPLAGNPIRDIDLNRGGEEGVRLPVVIAGLLGTDADEHAVAVACRLAGTIAPNSNTGEPIARMHLARVLIVPRELPLAAPLIDEDAAAKRLTQFASAVHVNGCVATVVTQIERTRDGGIRLTDLVGELHAEFLVLALSMNASSEDVSIARYVVERAPCEVIVNRVLLSELHEGEGALTLGKEQKHEH